MKLRPVLLVLLIVGGFYYLTSRLMPAGALAGVVHRGLMGLDGTTQQALRGPLGTMSLTEANAAPAFDTEEQQNIGVYKKALPSVVNITSTAVAYDFFYRPVPQQGQGSGFILDTEGHILTNNHVIEGAQAVEVTLYNKKKYKATIVSADRGHDIALLQIKGAGDAGRLEGTRCGPARICDWQSIWVLGHDDPRDHLGAARGAVAERSERGRRDPDGRKRQSG
jgi:S1-C subfamily serine protease